MAQVMKAKREENIPVLAGVLFFNQPCMRVAVLIGVGGRLRLGVLVLQLLLSGSHELQVSFLPRVTVLGVGHVTAESLLVQIVPL